ncbi:hypothetical protein OG874_33665 [Nocardia sp. NBC_00565]|uniref:hypothetical protein n=1 Tax=Nocardia sp. NBC_00565 TaxID=2975993 RepID=UPI002E80A5F1|nr:hypothetical protein [Nocardia sp. NBC_00565]WUC01686.1 hypothetical protein OG874_33665 [Nocardia sp. NBC_00565]
MNDFDDRPEPTRSGAPSQQQPYGAGQFGPALGPSEFGQSDPTDHAQSPSAQAQNTFGAPVDLDSAASPPFGGAPEPTLQWQPGVIGSTRTSSAPGQLDPTTAWAPRSAGSAQHEPSAQWAPAASAPYQPSVQWEPVPRRRTRQFQSGATTPEQAGAPPADGGLSALYGGQRSPGFPTGSNGRPGRGRGAAWVAAAVAALVVAGGATAAIVAADRGSDETTAQDTPPSMVSALTTTGGSHTAPPTTTPEPTQANNETPVVPGYKVVVASDLGAAYDVPADWTVAPDGKVGGFGAPPNAVTGKGLATDGKSYCPGSTRTVAFLTGSKDNDSAIAATELGTRTAEAAYTNSPGGMPSPAQPLNSLDGAQQGMFVETKGIATKVNPGCATNYSVYTFATPTDNGSFVMVIAADTGVPNAVDADTAKRIFTSIRPHKE